MYIVPTYTYLPGLVYPVLICAALFLISPLFMNVASEADKSDAVSGYIDEPLLLIIHFFLAHRPPARRNRRPEGFPAEEACLYREGRGPDAAGRAPHPAHAPPHGQRVRDGPGGTKLKGIWKTRRKLTRSNCSRQYSNTSEFDMNTIRGLYSRTGWWCIQQSNEGGVRSEFASNGREAKSNGKEQRQHNITRYLIPGELYR